MRKRIVKSFALLPAALVCLHLAAAVPRAQEAYKIDEAKNPRCDLSEVPPLDPPPYGKFAAALYDTPQSRGAVMVYGFEGLARVYARLVRERLVNHIGLPAERLLTIYGGPAEELRMELWVMPGGAAEPRSNFAEDTKSAREFARYSYREGEVCPPTLPTALEIFAEALKQRPGWRGYIVVRPHRKQRGVRARRESWDPYRNISRRMALRLATRDRLRLVKEFGVPPARVTAVAGADDRWTHGELWLVPPGAEPPAAKAARAKQAKVD